MHHLHTVAGGKVPVDDLLPVQELNAADDLYGHVHQLLSVERLKQFNVVNTVIMTVCSAMARVHVSLLLL